MSCFPCPLNGLRVGDTILLEDQQKEVTVLKGQYQKDNVHLRIFYKDAENKISSFTGEEFDTAFLKRPDIAMDTLEEGQEGE